MCHEGSLAVNVVISCGYSAVSGTRMPAFKPLLRCRLVFCYLSCALRLVPPCTLGLVPICTHEECPRTSAKDVSLGAVHSDLDGVR
jgi:hypothetical protein